MAAAPPGSPASARCSARSWGWIAGMWWFSGFEFGVRPADAPSCRPSATAATPSLWGAQYACEKIGCLVLPGGNMTTEARVRMLVENGATVVCSTPTYALRMAQEARKLGLDLPGSAVRRLILSGEPAGSIPATKKLIEEQWGAKAGDTAGMTEVGTIIMFECNHQPGGAHLIEDHYVEEVIDPGSGEPVAYGELGERVVTSFGRGFIPSSDTARATSCEASRPIAARAAATSTSTTAASAGAWTT